MTLLDSHVHQRRLGQVFAAGLKVVLGEPSGLGPDVVYISTGRMDNMRASQFSRVRLAQLLSDPSVLCARCPPRL